MKSILFSICAFCTLSGFAQWQAINAPNLSQPVIYAQSADTFHIASNSGIFFNSNDGGLSYTKDSTNLLGGWLLDIGFANANIGYSCGGTAFGPYTSPILKTVNGGITWDTLITNAYGGYDLNSLHVLNAQTAYFGGSGFLVKTTDGGNTFSVDTLGVGVVVDIHFFTPSVGMVVMNEDVLRTTNGGQTWDTVFTDTSQVTPWSLPKLQFPDNGSIGYLLTNNGQLVKTINSGLSWSFGTIITSDFWITDINFPSENVGYATTSDPLFFQNSGNILGTNDGGLTWVSLVRSDTGSFQGISMASDYEGYAVSYRGVYKTTNGGGLHLPNSKKRAVEIYPNPAHDYLNIKVESQQLETFELLDIKGRLIRAFDTDVKQLNLSGIAPGVYFIELTFQKGEKQIEKIVVE